MFVIISSLAVWSVKTDGSVLFSHDAISSKTWVKFVNSQLLVPVSFDLSVVSQNKLFCLRSVCRLCLCHE